MQKFTIRPVILKHKANSKGFATVKIAVTVDRQVTYMSTKHAVHVDDQWDEKEREVINHPNAKLINISIKRDLSDIEKRLLNNSLQEIQLSKKVIRGDVMVSKKMRDYAREVRHDAVRLKRILDFGGQQMMISEVSVEWLRKFETWCRKKPLAQNTINSTFKYLQQIITQAKKEKYLIENPFEQYHKPRYVQSERIYLVQDELQRMVDLLNTPMNQSLYNTLCYFLLGCLTGLRHSDWGRYKHMGVTEDGLIKQTAKKNKKHVVIPVGKTLKRVLKLIEDQPLPFTNQKCNVYLKSLASMANIQKDITTHSARHTFGCLCASLGLPESTTAKLMGINGQTVKVYYHLTGEDLIHQTKALMHI
jgi:site-specific recombinase XerD